MISSYLVKLETVRGRWYWSFHFLPSSFEGEITSRFRKHLRKYRSVSIPNYVLFDPKNHFDTIVPTSVCILPVANFSLKGTIREGKCAFA